MLDINDNNPHFSQDSYSYSVNEAMVGPDGLSLLTIVTNDADGTSPNNLVTYNITDGNDADTFEINSTTVSVHQVQYYLIYIFIYTQGEIRAVKDLDYESEISYTVTVTAVDNPNDATQTRSNSTQVYM